MSDWNINGFVAKTDNLAEDALKVTGLWLAGQSKRLTPTITARAKNSISSAVKGGKRDGLNDATPGIKGKGEPKPEEKAKEGEGVPIPKSRLAVWVGTSLSYFPFIEYGTNRTGKSGSMASTSRGSKAQAPLRLALYSNKKQLFALFARNMKR